MGMGMTDPSTGQPMEFMNIIMPSVIFELEMAVTGVDAANNMITTSTVSAVGVEERPGSMPGLVDTLTQQLASMMGLTSQVTLSPTGRLIQQDDHAAGGAEPRDGGDLKDGGAGHPEHGRASAGGGHRPRRPMDADERQPAQRPGGARDPDGHLGVLEDNVATVRFTVTQDLLRGDGA
jgi:hypothetical protein